MDKKITNEYKGEEKLENLSKTTITYSDGSETVITYRDKIGGELMSESTPIEVITEKKEKKKKSI